jgi:hypothetical protein
MPKERPVPECTLFYDAATGMYGFSFRFAGGKPHFVMGTFRTLEDAKTSADPHSEMVWEEPSDADESKLLVSRTLKPGAVQFYRGLNFRRTARASLSSRTWNSKICQAFPLSRNQHGLPTETRLCPHAPHKTSWYQTNLKGPATNEKPEGGESESK